MSYFFHVKVCVKLSFQTVCIHISYFPENLSFFPWAVMLSEAPRHSGEPVWASAIKFVFVVKVEGGFVQPV